MSKNKTIVIEVRTDGGSLEDLAEVLADGDHTMGLLATLAGASLMQWLAPRSAELHA